MALRCLLDERFVFVAMVRMCLAAIEEKDTIFFGLAVLLVFTLMVIIFFVGAWMQKHYVGVSPYTGQPLRRASDLPYQSARNVLLFMYQQHAYDNRLFELKKATFCRETGRIFTNCVSFLGTVHLDWTFLQKRFPGDYVSWGSLNDIQRAVIQDAHESMAGFQTKHSCPIPAPNAITKEYSYTKPGPLYVDLQTKVLLGWQCVPNTELEVLIVQKPKKKILTL